jgi:uncharacterized protein YjiS (DUF1127 family)
VTVTRVTATLVEVAYDVSPSLTNKMMELNMSTQEFSMTQNMSATERTSTTRSLSDVFIGTARSVWEHLAAYLYRRALKQAERELMSLDDRMLHDIGLTRSEIPAAVRRAEANLLMPIVP